MPKETAAAVAAAAVIVVADREDFSPIDQIWIGLPVTAIAASLSASEWVG
jgi:hypothetical protein